MFYKIDTLNFHAKFTGKNLWLSPSFNKATGPSLQPYQKGDPATGVVLVPLHKK